MRHDMPTEIRTTSVTVANTVYGTVTHACQQPGLVHVQHVRSMHTMLLKLSSSATDFYASAILQCLLLTRHRAAGVSFLQGFCAA
jgi:hypothetical protein